MFKQSHPPSKYGFDFNGKGKHYIHIYKINQEKILMKSPFWLRFNISNPCTHNIIYAYAWRNHPQTNKWNVQNAPLMRIKQTTGASWTHNCCVPNRQLKRMKLTTENLETNNLKTQNSPLKNSKLTSNVSRRKCHLRTWKRPFGEKYTFCIWKIYFCTKTETDVWKLGYFCSP